MVAFYVDRIHRGKTTIDKVPPALKAQVIEAYNEKYPDEPLEAE